MKKVFLFGLIPSWRLSCVCLTCVLWFILRPQPPAPLPSLQKEQLRASVTDTKHVQGRRGPSRSRRWMTLLCRQGSRVLREVIDSSQTHEGCFKHMTAPGWELNGGRKYESCESPPSSGKHPSAVCGGCRPAQNHTYLCCVWGTAAPLLSGVKWGSDLPRLGCSCAITLLITPFNSKVKR